VSRTGVGIHSCFLDGSWSGGGARHYVRGGARWARSRFRRLRKEPELVPGVPGGGNGVVLVPAVVARPRRRDQWSMVGEGIAPDLVG